MRSSVFLGSVFLLAAGVLPIESGRAESPSHGSGATTTRNSAIRTEPAASANDQLSATRTDIVGPSGGEHSDGSSATSKVLKANGEHGDENATGAAADAQQHVDAAVQAVKQMKTDPHVTDLLQRAKGVFIVPSYGKAAIVVGGRGGEGVLLVRKGQEWSNPAFFSLGGITVGAQAGIASGPVAMLLMSDKAVQQFSTQQNSFSLNADAGLTIVNYSAEARAAAPKGDVVVWSATKGLFAGAALGVSDIRRDVQQNHAYYSRAVTPQEIFGGVVSSTNADALRETLPNRVAATE